MLASTKNDNVDCISQGAHPVYPPIFKVLLGCLSAMKNPFFDQASIGKKIVRWFTSTKRVRKPIGWAFLVLASIVHSLYKSRLQFTPYLLMGCNLSII